MTTPIKTWSTTASGNNALVPPFGAPEGGTNLNQVSDIFRQLQASIRQDYETAEWKDFGDVPTYLAATQFSVPNDLRIRYQVGRRVRAVNATLTTIYGTITAVAYTTVTTVTVAWDSGTLDSTLAEVAVGLLSFTNPSISLAFLKAFGLATINGLGPLTALASAATTDLGTIAGNNVSVTGTTPITSFGSSASLANPIYQVLFSGVLVLTHNATSLILPSAANITTAAGDSLFAQYLGSGNWRVLSYTLANGRALVTPVATTSTTGSVTLASPPI